MFWQFLCQSEDFTEEVVEETRQVMKKRRVEKQKEVQPDDEVLSSKPEEKKFMYPRTTWDIPRAFEKPNFKFLKVPEWVNGRAEGEEVTDEQFTTWGLEGTRMYSLEGVGEETKNSLKRRMADVECRYWKPEGEILAAHVGIQETTIMETHVGSTCWHTCGSTHWKPFPYGIADKTEINIKIYQVSGEVWGDFTYRDHERIEDLYMDLLPYSFVKAIRDEEGKDINMEDKIKKYKQIIIEARAFFFIGPRPGPVRRWSKAWPRSLADETIGGL